MKETNIISKIGKRCLAPVSILLAPDNNWLKPLLKQFNQKIVVVDGFEMLSETLILLGEENVSIIVIDMGYLTGEAALSFIKNSVSEIRKFHSNTGIVFAFLDKAEINNAFLPENTWAITRKSGSLKIKSILESIDSLKDDLYETSREWNVGEGIHIRKIRKEKPCFLKPCPNFNIKNPSILIPIALAAKEVNSPVCFEISPQESLIYYDSYGRSCKEKVKDVLTQIREEVDYVKKYLDTPIYLHLDHCDDPEIIMHAVNVGFDSIMADGSKQGLEANIKFVNNAIKYAAQYNVLIEAEVGTIDLYGRQKSSKTNIDDFIKFFESSKPDFIGVNIGQIHGSDYGFDRARVSYRELTDLIYKHRDLDPQSLYLACDEIQKEIEEGSETQNALIKYIKYKALSNIHFESLDELLSSYRRGTLYDEYILARIESKWNKNRRKISDQIVYKYEEVLGIGIKDSPISEDKHFLDIALLNDLKKLLKNSETSLVLHGGSSIYSRELRILKNYRVSRINFGSEIFQLYLNTLYNYHQIHTDSKDLYFVKKFLNRYTENWKEWVTSPPIWLKSFKQEIISKYFEPLL